MPILPAEVTAIDRTTRRIRAIPGTPFTFLAERAAVDYTIEYYDVGHFEEVRPVRRDSGTVQTLPGS